MRSAARSMTALALLLSSLSRAPIITSFFLRGNADVPSNVVLNIDQLGTGQPSERCSCNRASLGMI